MGIFKDIKHISIHFSKAVGTPIITEDGKNLGTLKDFFVDYEEVYPLVLALQYRSKGQYFYIEWGFIKSFSYNKIVITEEYEVGRSRSYPKAKTNKIITSLLASQFTGTTMEFPAIGTIILDRQVVDTSGKKVVRVNDIQFIRSGQQLRVTHASIGLRSMSRRLGYENVIDFIVKKIKPSSKYLTNETLINWKFVHAIPNKNIKSNVKLTLSDNEIKKIHPADLADILEDLDSYGREILFSNLDHQTAADTLQEVEDDIKENLIRNEKPEIVAKIIEKMDVDDAADTLNELSKKRAEEIISKIQDEETVEEIKELREYNVKSAGGLMSKEFFAVAQNDSKDLVLNRFKVEHSDIENIFDIFVTDNTGVLLGICPIQNLLLCQGATPIKDVMISHDLKTVQPHIPWKEVAIIMSKYNLMNLPVLSLDRKLIGMISIDDILPWLLEEKK